MSIIKNTIEEIKTLKWYGFYTALEIQLSNSAYLKMSFEERLAHLIKNEITERRNRKIKQLLARSKLKYKQAYVEDIDYRPSRNLDKSTMLSLIGNEWIERSQNIIISGATGTGKTWLACAMGNNAIFNGYSVYYIRLSKLFSEIRLARADGSYLSWLKKLTRYNVLILDDFGSGPMKPSDVAELLEVVEDRSYTGSIIITSQLPVSAWHEYLNQPVVADAILDRLIHTSYRLELKGESLRKLKSTIKNN
ncbi:IS21-like element helper ATPase IstB [Calditrichota bacterium LG25]